MNTLSRITLAVMLVLAAAAPLGAQTDLLLFKDGRVLVRRTFPLRLPAGPSVQRIALDEHDAGSLAVLDTAVELRGVLYPYSLDVASLYRRAAGRRLVFQRSLQGDTVSALVLGMDPARFQVPGGVSLSPPGEPIFPAELVAQGRTVELSLDSRGALDALHLGYVTNGATWSAQYALTMRAGTASIIGTASLRSARLTADSAQITLLDGGVNRLASFAREPGLSPAFRLEETVVTATGDGEYHEPTVIGVGGVHLYELSGRHDLVPGMTSVVQLFRPVRAPVERTLTIPGSLPAAGNAMGVMSAQGARVELHYRVRRGRGTAFGEVALPAGVARLYIESAQGKRVLIGEAVINHSSAGADLDLHAGYLLDLTAQREDGPNSMAQDSVQRADGGMTIRNVAVLRNSRVTFTNRSDSTETIEVVERRGGPWTVVSSSVAAERPTPDAARFRVIVPARGEAVLTYRLRVPLN